MVERLEHFTKIKDQKQKIIKIRQEALEMKECTFQPKTVKAPVNL